MSERAVELPERLRSAGERAGERYADRRRWVVAGCVGLWAFVAATAALLLLGLVLVEIPEVRRQVTAFDREVLEQVVEARADPLDAVSALASSFTSTWTVVGVLVAATSLLAVQRRWRLLAVVVVAPAVELATFLLVSYVVARPRPDVALGMVPATASFPSGHAAMSVALHGALAFVVASMASSSRVRRGAAIVAGVVALLVGMSRVYGGLHYGTDVVVGWLLGAWSLSAGIVAGRAIAVRDERRISEVIPPHRHGAGERVRIVAMAAAALVVVWGVVVEPRVLLAVQHEEATIPDLTDAWEGATVGVIADLQVGMWLDNVGMVRQAAGRLVEERPDVALVLGDLVYGEDDVPFNVATVVEALSDLPEAGIPTFAVLGNHDHEADAVPLLVERLEAIGIEVLVNESVVLERAGDALHVVGIGAERPGSADVDAALAEVPDGAPRVVMMHNPKTFAAIPAGAAPLGVAGHTHGGQLRVPGTPEWSFLRLVQAQAVHADGWIPDYGAPGNELFVNRGIGMSLVPARFNCTPAITVFELRSG